MGENSRIEWTDHTFNPWWGCERISPACDHCYAATWAARLGFNDLWDGRRRNFADKHWQEPLQWNARAERDGKRFRVFCLSMGDVFDNGAPAGHRERLWSLIEATLHLDWLLLTKRIGNASRMLPPAWLAGPRLNVWIGATVVNQEEADRDIPKLLATPARVRFLSCEPLLGLIDLTCIPWAPGSRDHVVDDPSDGFDALRYRSGPHIDWVIAGGESGPHARPVHPDWIRELRDQCAVAEVPFLMKQWGEWLPGEVYSREGPEGLEGGFCRHQDGSEGVHVGTQDHWWAGDAFGGLLSSKVGKKVAGRLLDGRTWDQVPRVDR